jgi:hypothetical protein
MTMTGTNTSPALVQRRKRACHRVYGNQRKAGEALKCSQPMISGMLNGRERSEDLERQFSAAAGYAYETLFVAQR